MAIALEKMLEIARSLPPAARVFAELDVLLRDPNQSLEDIAGLVKRDAALTAHLIRVSNSVAVGGEQKTGSIEEALGRVGLEQVYRLVGEVTMGRLVERDLTHYGIAADVLREHLLHTAFVCEQLAMECGLDPRRAYTVGLMRALGMLVLDRVADRYEAAAQYLESRDDDYGVWEGRLFGLPSCEVGAMVLAEWKFPADIVEAVRNQHLARSSDLDHPLACIVNLAAGAIADVGQQLPGETGEWGLSPWKLESVGLDESKFYVASSRGADAYARYRGKTTQGGVEEKKVRTVVSDRENEAGEAGDTRDAGDVDETRVPDEVGVAEKAVEAGAAGKAESADDGAVPSPAALVAAEPEPAAEQMAESCNFEGAAGVVEANDVPPPVHTTEAGVSPVTDFTTFMRNYQDMVYSTAARITGNDAQAEDIAQEVFLKAYENYDNLSTSPTAGGWLKTVATNLSLNHLSRYRNRWRFFSEFKREGDADDRDVPEVEFAAPDTFFSGVDAEDRRALVDEALAKLPQHQRVPLVLYHFEDMPYDEIAKKTGVSLAKVKTDILRARAALAKILTRGGTAHEKVAL